MALLKNNKGEYKYQFNWMNENGTTNGFNSVWASNKREAVKKAKAMENPAHWAWYNGKEYITVPAEVTSGGHCFWNDGMYVDVKSMYKATQKQSDSMDMLSWMMSN